MVFVLIVNGLCHLFVVITSVTFPNIVPVHPFQAGSQHQQYAKWMPNGFQLSFQNVQSQKAIDKEIWCPCLHSKVYIPYIPSKEKKWKVPWRYKWSYKWRCITPRIYILDHITPYSLLTHNCLANPGSVKTHANTEVRSGCRKWFSQYLAILCASFAPLPL